MLIVLRILELKTTHDTKCLMFSSLGFYETNIFWDGCVDIKGLNKSVKYILERNKKTFKPSFKTTFNFSAYFQTSFFF